MNPGSHKTADSAFIEAINLVNQGKIQDAIERCRQGIAGQAEDVRLNALAGGLLLKLQEMDQAEGYLRRAMELAPNFAKVQEDLGYLLLETDRPEEAVELLSNATRINPGSEQGLKWLGRALAKLDLEDDADLAYDAALELNPVKRQLKLADDLHEAGRLSAAENAYKALLSEHPHDPEVLIALGRLNARQKQLIEAEENFRRAIHYAPQSAAALTALGSFLNRQNRHEEAIEIFTKATDLAPTNTNARYGLAWSYVRAGRTDKATLHFEKVLSLQPDNKGAWLALGHNLKTVGRQAEAIAAYRECIKVDPDNGEIYWSLANLKTYELTTEDMDAMREALQHADLADGSRVNFLFALAKSCEDKKNFDEAWRYYDEGNRLQRTLVDYDGAKARALNDKIIEVFNKDFLTRLAGQGCEDSSPIFIIGLPRSGSTLLEQILASHSMVEGTAELPYMRRISSSLSGNAAGGAPYPLTVRNLGPEALESLGEAYIKMAAPHRQLGRARFIDKMPNNFPHVGLIHLILPNAKIIDARRYPLDSTFSCFRQLFARGQTFVYSLKEIGDYFLEYQRLMDHWHEVLPCRALTVQYEDVATDLESQVRRILDYCELPFEESCLRYHETDRPVRTASSEQVRQPIYTRSIHHWRNFEPYIGELIETLEPVLHRYKEYEGINPR